MIRNAMLALVREYMALRGWNLGDLAEKVYIGRQTLSNHLKQPEIMTVGEINLVMDALGVSTVDRAEILSTLFKMNMEVKR